MKIGVLIIAYNQEKYIEQTLFSILNQEVDFDFEILVGDDNSSDKTFEICQRIQAQSKSIEITLIRSETNLGIIKNFQKCYNYLQVDYCFVCAGDDWWCDKTKMQKQINILKKSNEIVACCTSYTNYLEHSNSYKSVIKESHFIDENMIFFGNPIVPSSVCFAKFLIPTLDNHFTLSLVEDWTLWCMYIKFGRIYWLGDVTTAYRQHSSSAYAALENGKRSVWRFKAAEQINEKFRKQSNADFIDTESYYIALILFSKDLTFQERKMFYQNLRKYGIRMQLIILFLMLVFPRVNKLSKYFLNKNLKISS